MSASSVTPEPGFVGPVAPFRESGRLRDRIVAFVRSPWAVFRRNLDELPFDYPPGVVIIADLAFLLTGIAATVQRHEYFPSALPLLALALLFASLPLFAFLGVVPTPAQLMVTSLGATVMYLAQPVATDFAPFVLVVAAGEVAAISSKRVSVPFVVVSIGLLVMFDSFGKLPWLEDSVPLEGMPMYALGIVLGWMVGVMLQSQRRFLYQEREYQGIRAAQAAAEERRRIAREVHDVIAHSLSVTLLHLTAARHSLQTDRDVDEAVDALTDAERLGRQAMADIRRTVGLLDGPSKNLAEPSAEDIAALLDDFARAGLSIDAKITGDLDSVSAAVGLALYRIGQESLANVAKHAPGADVCFRLTVDPLTVTLAVANTLPAGSLTIGTGMGLTGMRHRAELLGGRMTAGPDGDGWSVEARFPHAPPRTSVLCGWLTGGLPVTLGPRGRRDHDVAFGPSGPIRQENA
ncbi:sensor histidine kinase [Nocardia cyriacigeorgica]|uniref:sensor histidine kinase n=1 Tax=Nocardia cyriacigeorgica TaxID=135487 RepID=UPI0013D2F47A|nr:histidine kinase [Nocardia cyriacigeorgica]NEW30249.1 histidine kinase [Nocardia cyriacigeorgica]